MSAGLAASAPVNKLMLEAAGRPILAWTLHVFERSPRVSRVYVTASEEDLGVYRALVEREGLGKVAAVVQGGRERQESVYLALQHISQHDAEAARNPLVAVHDGARPLLSQDKLEAVLAAAADSDGALLCVPAKETLKRVGADHVVLETVPRETMMVAQTPQTFRLHDLLEAHRDAASAGFAATDDAMLLERMGKTVRVVVGEYENIKVTTPEDLIALQGFLVDGSRH
jgi:2-C-methyl-D-erythritol 4-phosphate cytidylyltransferase